jgi:hypothetical protein
MAAMTSTPGEFKAGVNLFGVTNWIRTLNQRLPGGLLQIFCDPFTADP